MRESSLGHRGRRRALIHCTNRRKLTFSQCKVFCTIPFKIILFGSGIKTKSFPIRLQEVYAVSPFPLPGLEELREQYTYNINPFSDVTGDRSPRAAFGRGSSDEDDDELDLEGVGCLGALLPFSEFGPSNTVKAIGPAPTDVSDIAAASPGVFATDGYSPLPYTTKQLGSRGSRVQEELSFLQKQYARMRQMQQQAVVVFSEATVQNIQESEKRKSTPAAINHLLVSATKKKVKPTSRGHMRTRNANEGKNILFGDTASYQKGEAKSDSKPNAYEKESMQHLNELFKGDQKERKETNDASNTELKKSVTNLTTERTKIYPSNSVASQEKKEDSSSATVTNKDKRSVINTRKIQHVGLNGQVSSLETANAAPSRSALSVVTTSPKPSKITIVDTQSLFRETQTHNASPVQVLDKNSPSVFDSGRSIGVTGRVYSRSNRGPTVHVSNCSWLLEEDKRCKYPENFRPFPHRNKQPSRSRILYGNMSEKGARRIDAFQGKKDGRQGYSGVAVNGLPDSKRS